MNSKIGNNNATISRMRWFVVVCLTVSIIAAAHSSPGLIPYLCILSVGILIGIFMGVWLGGLWQVTVFKLRTKEQLKLWRTKASPCFTFEAFQVGGLVLFMVLSLYMWGSILLGSSQHMRYAAYWLILLALASTVRRYFWGLSANSRRNRHRAWMFVSRIVPLYIACCLVVYCGLVVPFKTFAVYIMAMGAVSLLGYVALADKLEMRRIRRNWTREAYEHMRSN